MKVKKVSLTVVIDPKHREYIKRHGEAPGYSMGEVVRELIEEAIEARQAKARVLA